MINKLKNAEKVLNQFSSKKDKENYISKIKDNRKKITLETYYYFYQKYPVKTYYQNIDYITLKIHQINYNLKDIIKKLTTIYDHKELTQAFYIPITKTQHIKLFNEFYILNLGEAFNGQKQIYGIYDIDKNKLGNIVIVNEDKKKTNNNIFNSIELTGLFFKCYKDYLNNFIEYLEIPKNENDVIKRIDYCLDFKGIEVFELLEYLKPIYKKTKNVDGLTATDKKILLKGFQSDIKYGRQDTFKNFLGSSNDFKIYDKILDLLQPDLLKRTVKGKNPYKDYIDSDDPIARLELKKKSGSFPDITDHSINYILENIESLFFDYIKKFFTIDLSLLVDQEINSLNGKKLYLAKDKKNASLDRCEKMVKANLKTIENLTDRNYLLKFLLKLYPELNTLNPLDLLDEFENLELISEIFNP